MRRLLWLVGGVLGLALAVLLWRGDEQEAATPPTRTPTQARADQAPDRIVRANWDFTLATPERPAQPKKRKPARLEGVEIVAPLAPEAGK